MGNYHLYEEDPSQQDIAVSAVHLHPEYSAWTMENDLCILDLAEQANLSDPNIGGGRHSRAVICLLRLKFLSISLSARQ